MKLPREFNYMEVYLTLRCNLNCSYCITNLDNSLKRKRKEMSAKEWADALNKIDFDIPLTLGGGEPTLYRGFYGLLDRLKPSIQVDLLTNLSFDVFEFVERTNPNRFSSRDIPAYRSIRVSYHPSQMNPTELVEKARFLQDRGFPIGIFGINHPENIEANMEMAELARKNQVYFFIKDFLGEYKGKLFGYFKYPDAINGKKKKVMCRTKEVLVSPEGLIYRCHRDLYHNENPIGDIRDGIPEFKFRECNNYGECNPCDVKLKTNRFLQMGNCQVEIK